MYIYIYMCVYIYMYKGTFYCKYTKSHLYVNRCSQLSNKQAFQQAGFSIEQQPLNSAAICCLRRASLLFP